MDATPSHPAHHRRQLQHLNRWPAAHKQHRRVESIIVNGAEAFFCPVCAVVMIPRHPSPVQSSLFPMFPSHH